MRVLVAHPGTQHSYPLVKELHKHALLYQFWTCFAVAGEGIGGKLYKYLPTVLTKKIRNRIIEGLEPGFLKTIPFLEVKSAIDNYLGSSENSHFKRNELFQRLIPDQAILSVDVVIGFDTSSWILAQRCKELGKKFILDVSIGHPISKKRIFESIAQTYPQWMAQIIPKSDHLVAIECREMQLADTIVVPSEFVKSTYLENGVLSSKIETNPFGTDIELFKTADKTVKDGGKIRFLFFGSFTARKGLALLLETWKSIDCEKAELTIAGYGKIPAGFDLPPSVVNKGVISKEDRQVLFDAAHVFVFPSYFEGFAQVQIEAAACGLPLIGTFNSGGSEIIKHGVNGFLISIDNHKELEESITYFIDNPGLIFSMGKASRKIADDFSWEAYGLRWKGILTR